MLAPQIERIDDLGIARLAGATSLSGAVAMITAAIDEAKQQGVDRLLLVTKLNDVAPPSVAARHAMVREWADAAGGRVRVALVVPSHFIDPDNFGAVVAANFGLIGNGFTTEAEAIAWLREFP